MRNQAGENSCNRRIFTLTALLVMKWLFEHQKKHWSTSLSAAPVTIITINRDVKWSRSFIRPRPLNVTAWSDSWWWTVFHLRLTADQHRLQHNPPQRETWQRRHTTCQHTLGDLKWIFFLIDINEIKKWASPATTYLFHSVWEENNNWYEHRWDLNKSY